MTTLESIKRFLIPKQQEARQPIPEGLYHYSREANGTYTRFHLRVDPDGHGMLLANATIAARLSPSGVLIAKELLEGTPEKAIYDRLQRTFRGASRERMERDLERVAALIANLASPGDNYPIINLEDAAISPYEARLIAPLQADVPLAEPEKILPIVDRLWEAAIPHVTFLVPDNADMLHLVRAVERAEDLGMIAGIRARALYLQRSGSLADLANAGLDHVTIPYASAAPAIHDDLLGAGDHESTVAVFEELIALEVAPVAEIPLIDQTLGGLIDTLNSLLAHSIGNVLFFAIAAPDDLPPNLRAGALAASAMPQTAGIVEDLSNQLQVRFIWQPTVMRDPARRMSEQVRQGARTSDELSILVKPDGEVIPPRGPYRSAGNLLTDEWTSIWNDDSFRRYRERIERPTRCDDCPDLVICAADCPRKQQGWSQPAGVTS
jgi:radical SAM protein with 4Fe4S-binding SPASM domain